MPRIAKKKQPPRKPLPRPAKVFIVREKAWYSDSQGLALVCLPSLAKAEQWIRENYPQHKRVRKNEDGPSASGIGLWFENETTQTLVLVDQDGLPFVG